MAAPAPHPVLRVFFFVLGAILIFLLLRMLLFKPFLLVSVIGTLATVGVVVGWYRNNARQRAAADYRASEAGMIETRLDTCRQRIRDNERELHGIEESLTALRGHLRQDGDALPRTRAETERLLAAYEREAQLRTQRIAFYRECIQKLLRLQRNHALTRRLESEHAKLKQLQERHYDELADLEDMRTSLAYEQRYLETLDALSLRLLESESPRDVAALTRELEQLSEPPPERPLP